MAIIPARGGSKRIPRKNIKLFYGKPLISYTIDVAIQSKLFERIIVSTDDEEIASIAVDCGAEVPHLRSKELADDYTPAHVAVEAMLAGIQHDYDFACTLYATAPFLQVKYLQEGLEKLRITGATNAFSVSKMSFPIQRAFRITKRGRCEMFAPENYFKRSQDLEESYQDAAQFYWKRLNSKSKNIIFGEDSVPVILPNYLVQDIDTPADWKRAEIMYEILEKQGEC